MELEGFAHEGWGCDGCSGGFSAFDTEYPFALEAIEVLSKASAIGEKVVPLDGEHEEGIDFVKGVEGTKEVPRMTVGGEGEQVAEGGRYQGRQLLLRQ